jgi:hypothetical protein
MQDEKKDSSSPDKKGEFPRRAKGCMHLIASILVACFILVITAIAGIIIVDSISIRGEGYTMSQRVERYKVACQFIWADFRSWVSRRFPDEHEPPDENESSD